MPAWGSLSILEAVWITVCLVGGWYCLANLHSAVGDRHYIYAEKLNGGRRLVADNNVRREAMRLAGIGASLLVGVYSAAPLEWQAPLRGWFAPIMLMLIPASMALNSFLDQRQRVALLQLLKVMEYWSHKKNGGHAAGEHPA